MPTLFLFVILCHASLALLRNPYLSQTFKLPNHPLNWICTVHVTVPSLSNHTSSDITERFLTSNHGKVIPTLSTMLNRNISIAPVDSFFEPCTVSVLVDETIHGSSYVQSPLGMKSYIQANEYVFRGWRHSVVIVFVFSCATRYSMVSNYLPHRLFYHSLGCGPQHSFPNFAFVPDPLGSFKEIDEQMHNIHDPQLPLAVRRSTSKPKYGWDEHIENWKPEDCLPWYTHQSRTNICTDKLLVVYHYKHILNFTTVPIGLDEDKHYGQIITKTIITSKEGNRVISIHIIDSSGTRILYCDRKLDMKERFRPLNLSSPFSFGTWIMLVSTLMLCAIANSLTIFDMSSGANSWTTLSFIQTVFNCLFVLIVSQLEQDLGKKNSIKIFIGLMVIFLGNFYKNDLTIELVYPRTQNAFGNVTELLDSNFNILLLTDISFNKTRLDKSTILKNSNYHMEIDEHKRDKYIRQVDRWFLLIKSVNALKKFADRNERNALFVSAPFHIQQHTLSLYADLMYPFPCHFVKRPFASKFIWYYFFNPKAEELKQWTARFFDHGLFECWKRLQAHQIKLVQLKYSPLVRLLKSNRRSTQKQSFDLNNFIGNVHLLAFYNTVSILVTIFIVVFLSECAMQTVKNLSILALTKLKQASLKLLWTIVRFLF
jgi:hypothetical protein